jgi:predicted ATPase
MIACDCAGPHRVRRVVLTGGPGAGKTATLELVRRALCPHVHVLQEAAGILFAGGFPRAPAPLVRRAAQRAIYFTQRELEAVADAGDPALVLCDRGTVDGVAYWPGPGDLWSAVGTTLEDELRRYHAVVHLRTPPAASGYDRRNPLRVETAAEAAAIDERILRAWQSHPRRVVVDATPDFLAKVARALVAVQAEVPACCRREAPRASP